MQLASRSRKRTLSAPERSSSIAIAFYYDRKSVEKEGSIIKKTTILTNLLSFTSKTTSLTLAK